mmetsp:Transcript_119936/g.344683  ORF Transcript_119936/g.344683 Transcript_119936/m.344683 type:complete len:224 (-) Transcript_119936:1448-2119(-)
MALLRACCLSRLASAARAATNSHRSSSTPSRSSAESFAMVSSALRDCRAPTNSAYNSSDFDSAAAVANSCELTAAAFTAASALTSPWRRTNSVSNSARRARSCMCCSSNTAAKRNRSPSARLLAWSFSPNSLRKRCSTSRSERACSSSLAPSSSVTRSHSVSTQRELCIDSLSSSRNRSSKACTDSECWRSLSASAASDSRSCDSSLLIARECARFKAANFSE